MYTYDQFLELDSESQLAFVQKEGTIILEQKCSYFHSILYGLGSFDVELVDDLATGKVKIKRTYCSPVHYSNRPAFYK
ncbi:hypothetical protein [Chryseobacterium sp. Leaf394]|uniref:hypothetical protein n=1 Tax=Chryseobacterium sp. Leaf394 TaxID=1736361 RepID=UPI0006F2C966|nr:hypothetical protein [Chryseobacterium sp. Leaf394]KQS91916.1 hypothetical protein ASG21_05510 [Chryseobacterium sp. Leaf394]